MFEVESFICPYSVHWGHCSDDSGPRTHYFVLTPWLHGFLLATFQEGAIYDMSVLEFEVIKLVV